ncbi:MULTISPECIES: DUF1427 family protein [Streptomyces]|nr:MULTISPECIES: DUF1427 family protein [Streptomyces]MCG7205469.1 DUF1427 family protein [Streptomyces arenae]
MAYVQTLLAGTLAGALYAALRVKAPAPPPVALAGLLGILIGQTVLERL